METNSVAMFSEETGYKIHHDFSQVHTLQARVQKNLGMTQKDK